MEFGYTEDRIDETYETKLRRAESLRDTLYGASHNSYNSLPFLNSRSRKELNKLRTERIMKKREELMKLVNRKSVISPVVLKEVSLSR